MPRLRKFNRLCSRTVSDTANRLRKTRKKKSSAVPNFERSHGREICARLGSREGRSYSRGNRRCPFLFALRRGYGAVPALRRAQLPAEVQRKTPRPSDGEPPAAVRFSEKEAARQANLPGRQFACPAQPMQKRSRPSEANPPAAVRVPRSAGAEKEPPVRGEPACGSSRARSAGAGKGAARQGRTRLRQFVCPGHLVPRKEKHRRIASTVLKVCTFTQIAAAYRHPYAPEPAGPVPDDRAR